MKKHLFVCTIAILGLITDFAAGGMTITSKYTQWPSFSTFWNKDALLMNSTTNTASIQTPSTTISNTTHRTTDMEEPAIVALNEMGYSASARASDEPFHDLTCTLSSEIPNSTTTTQSRFEQTLFFRTADTGSFSYLLELAALPRSYITCSVSSPGQSATASVTHRLNLAFYESGSLVDTVETTKIFNFTEQSYQNYDLLTPFTYTGYFASSEVRCVLTSELISTIQIPEPAALLLFALGGFMARKNKHE